MLALSLLLQRDFLRALQICEIPQFQSGQDCRAPKILGSGIIFESTPECIKLRGPGTKNRIKRLFRPDAMLGECVDSIGNRTLHPPTRREWSINNLTNTTDYDSDLTQHGYRLQGYGGDNRYDKYHFDNPFNLEQGELQYPLWHADDFRHQAGGDMYKKRDGSTTSFHLHNFFPDADTIHKKYHTYGHAVIVGIYCIISFQLFEPAPASC